MILAIANAMGLREDMIATGGKVDELLKSTLFVSYLKDFW